MNDQNLNPQQSDLEDDDSISLLDLLLVLAAGRKTIFKITGWFALGAIVISLLMSNVYTSKTSLIPPNNNQLSPQSAVAAQITALAGGGGLAAALKNPADLWVALLKSDSVETFVIRENNLIEIYDVKNMALAIKKLEDTSKISADKSGLINIEVENKDAELAAKIANSFVTGLAELNKRLVFSQAGQKRLFFEQQLQLARDGLANAEHNVAAQLENQGVVPDDIRKRLKTIPRAADETAAQLRGQIAAKELQISAMKSYATDQNLSLIQTQQELAALQDKLSSLQGLDDAQTPKADSTTTNSPQKAQRSIQRAIQDIRYYDSYIQILMDQYEQARLDEAKEPMVLQVVDVATPPEIKSKPKRVLIVIISTLAGLFLSILWVLLRNGLNKAKSNPETAEKLAQINRNLPLDEWWQCYGHPITEPILKKLRPMSNKVRSKFNQFRNPRDE